MNTLKFIRLFCLSLILSLGIVTFNACKTDDPCKGVECPANADCVEGECYCKVGFEGTNCDQLIRAKYIGLYTANDVCESGTFPYEVEIIAGSDSLSFIVKNFGDFQSPPATVVGKILDSDSFEFTKQDTDPTSANRYIESTEAAGGSYAVESGKKVVKVKYKVTYNDNSTDECTLTLTQK